VRWTFIVGVFTGALLCGLATTASAAEQSSGPAATVVASPVSVTTTAVEPVRWCDAGTDSWRWG
jgi:hypothetical protein